MKRTTFSKFRNSAASYFNAVEEKGVSIEIYRHGKLAAVLIPPPPSQPARLGKGNPISLPGVSLSTALLQERDRSE